MDGCDYIIHNATPFPMIENPAYPDDLVGPAVKLTHIICDQALHSKVKRLVITSSILTMMYGGPGLTVDKTANDWTTPALAEAHALSKTMSELEAWNFCTDEHGGLEIVSINVGLMFGPNLNTTYKVFTEYSQA